MQDTSTYNSNWTRGFLDMTTQVWQTQGQQAFIKAHDSDTKIKKGFSFTNFLPVVCAGLQ